MPDSTTPAGTAPSIQETISDYLEEIRASRSKNTHKTYRFALDFFVQTLEAAGLSPSLSVKEIDEETSLLFLTDLKDLSVATERLYVTALLGYYDYLVDEGHLELNLTRIRNLIHKRSRRAGIRLPQFPRQAIENVCDYYYGTNNLPVGDETDTMIYLRDRAFIITLADTGLRVHEACGLTRGMIDWNESKAVIIGKGNKEAVIRFSRRSLKVIKDYLAKRAAIDGASGRPLSSLPVFSRHDRGAGKKLKPISTKTGREIVETRVKQALGDDETADQITPHSFRHYFVTVILRGTGNMKLAQELARHSSLSTTQRYAHLSNDELDAGYEKVFEDE